jgi:hypothetical protein
VRETQQDRELERYLQGGDPLSSAYDSLRDEMPSPEMDRRVLHEARAAMTRARRFPRWQTYAAIAATVLLSFGAVMRLSLDELDMKPTTRQDSVSTATPAAPSPAAQGAPVYTAPTDDFIELKRAESQALQAEQDPLHAKAEAGPTREAAAVGGGTRSGLQRPVEKIVGEKRLPDASVQSGVQSSGEPAELSFAVAPPASAPVQRERGIAAAAPEQERHLKDDLRGVTVTGSRVQSEHVLVQQPPQPEAWLKYIEQLRKDGKPGEAEAQMRRFVETYPDYKTAADAAPTR